jgi:transposase
VLAKSVHDAGWSAFVAMREYKARMYGREFMKIGRFEPTSQVCSECGVKDGPKPLHVREWDIRRLRRTTPRLRRGERRGGSAVITSRSTAGTHS